MTLLLIVTVSSMLLAAVMSAIAWRIAAEERRRSDARIAALAAEIHAPAAAAAPRAVAAQASGARRAEVNVRADAPRLAAFGAQRPAARWDEDLPIRPVVVDHGSPAPDLFTPPQTHSRGPVVAIVGAVVVAAALAALVVAGHRVPPTATAKGPATTTETASASATGTPTATRTAPASVPLELIALGHDRDGDRLTVRGIVRNPSSAAAVEQLTAVVLAFKADGGFLTSGRAIIESSALRPGGEATFLVTVPNAASAGRYRVSFRSGDRVVPHVDRRDSAKASS